MTIRPKMSAPDLSLLVVFISIDIRSTGDVECRIYLLLSVMPIFSVS